MKTQAIVNPRVLLQACGLLLAISVLTAAQQAFPAQGSAGASGAPTGTSQCPEPVVVQQPPSTVLDREQACARTEDATGEEQSGANADAQQPQKQLDASPSSPQSAEPSSGNSAEKGQPANQQPKRILGVMPNFRAVTAGTLPAPPTPKQSFILATQNSFDYSSFIFVGFTSAFAEWTNAHSQLGQGMTGYGRYYWRGFLDKTDGNYLVLFALPTVFHQDERYYARGKGGFWRRFSYAATRIFVTPDYEGHNSFNYSELLGRGMAQGISVFYYPGQTRTVGGIGSKYGYAIMRDALTNVFREFWPDIATHVLHRHP